MSDDEEYGIDDLDWGDDGDDFYEEGADEGGRVKEAEPLPQKRGGAPKKQDEEDDLLEEPEDVDDPEDLDFDIVENEADSDASGDEVDEDLAEFTNATTRRSTTVHAVSTNIAAPKHYMTAANAPLNMVIIRGADRITSEYLSTNEYAGVIAFRAQSIAKDGGVYFGPPPPMPLVDPVDIAKHELRTGHNPLKIRRHVFKTGNTLYTEEWLVRELI